MNDAAIGLLLAGAANRPDGGLRVIELLVGGAIALIGAWLGHVFTSRRERKKWLRAERLKAYGELNAASMELTRQFDQLTRETDEADDLMDVKEGWGRRPFREIVRAIQDSGGQAALLGDRDTRDAVAHLENAVSELFAAVRSSSFLTAEAVTKAERILGRDRMRFEQCASKELRR